MIDTTQPRIAGPHAKPGLLFASWIGPAGKYVDVSALVRANFMAKRPDDRQLRARYLRMQTIVDDGRLRR